MGLKKLILGAGLLAGAAAGPAQAATDDPHWIVRLRAIRVTPTERTGPIEPSFPTAHTAVTNSYAPELDITYMATKHVGAEVIFGTTKHDVQGRGALDSLGKAGHTWVLPPTLTLQYHFLPDGHIRPYLGAGINYTIFYNEKASDGLQAAIGKTKFGLSDSIGFAAQAGVDVDIARNVFINLDLKYIDIETRAELTTGALVNRERVHLDPLVPGVGVGIRF